MSTANLDIRMYAKAKSVSLWEIANALEISEASMTRKMRVEIRGDEKESIKQLIDSIATREEGV